jgi:hypothetical protein
MIRLVVLASLLISCRITLDTEELKDCEIDMTQATCTGAEGHADLTWIQQNVFTFNCGSTSCHGASASPGGGLDMRDKATTYSHLVGVTSSLEPSRKLVVTSDVNKSYLMVMVRGVSLDMADPPAQAPANGYMPKGIPKGLCCQKLDALERWITAGAQNN